MSSTSALTRLPPEVTKILYVRNLPYKIESQQLYELFAQYGAVRQIRLGSQQHETKGSALVVYDDIYQAKEAHDKLQGFNLMGRYLIVIYYQPNKMTKRVQQRKQEEELEALKKKLGLPTQQ